MIYYILDNMLKDASGLHNSIQELANNPLTAWAINFWLSLYVLHIAHLTIKTHTCSSKC